MAKGKKRARLNFDAYFNLMGEIMGTVASIIIKV